MRPPIRCSETSARAAGSVSRSSTTWTVATQPRPSSSRWMPRANGVSPHWALSSQERGPMWMATLRARPQVSSASTRGPRSSGAAEGISATGLPVCPMRRRAPAWIGIASSRSWSAKQGSASQRSTSSRTHGDAQDAACTTARDVRREDGQPDRRVPAGLGSADHHPGGAGSPKVPERAHQAVVDRPRRAVRGHHRDVERRTVAGHRPAHGAQRGIWLGTHPAEAPCEVRGTDAVAVAPPSVRVWQPIWLGRGEWPGRHSGQLLASVVRPGSPAGPAAGPARSEALQLRGG